MYTINSIYIYMCIFVYLPTFNGIASDQLVAPVRGRWNVLLVAF